MIIKHENWGTINKNSVILEKPSKTEGYTCSITIVFSYETPVHFGLRGAGVKFTEMTRENDWSNTTGKLISQFADKKHRVSGKMFEASLSKALIAFYKA